MEPQEIKPCPFCGNAPVLRVDRASGFEQTCWAWIDCNKCWVKPHVGASSSMGYYLREYPYSSVPLKTEEEAMAQATKDVIRHWNERAPVNEVPQATAQA